ncbi:eukaryotic translation initiation factor 2-alpha kinase 3-like [Olea europaea var. sylvestris]|uniref:eukaryotic translation initiation factor 2-alpha kinase 3-like n=1 Tax=Olea europaea var. sylvestris TaxID=158386 RepID=UPI000C1D711A|nr:eukaryotic translation initiation factor 2-alpha kinase 3-like [Olea europaea var. sylvestris]
MSSSVSSDILCPNNGDVIWTSIKLPNGEESRYRTNFTELRPIGSGGFGVVAECENKLDQKVYAVKKISLKAANMSFQKISRYNIQFSITFFYLLCNRMYKLLYVERECEHFYTGIMT